MTQVTGYNAERMKEIEDSAIIGGVVVVDNLILARRDGSTFDAGDIRGPKGDTGNPGEVTDAELAVVAGDVTTLQSDLATANGNIATNAAGLVSLADALDDEISDTNDDIIAAKARLTTLEASIVEQSGTAVNGWGGTVYYWKKGKQVWWNYERGSTNGTASTIFTLPSGYRPKRQTSSLGYANGLISVGVSTGGVISASTGGSYMYTGGTFLTP